MKAALTGGPGPNTWSWGVLDDKEMKREEEEEEEEEVVSVDEEDPCTADTQHYELRSVFFRPLLQGGGRHLVAKHLNCSCLSQPLHDMPPKTFIQVLSTCFCTCVILSVLRIKYEGGLWFFGFKEVFLDFLLVFFVLGAVVSLKLMMKMTMMDKLEMKSTMKDKLEMKSIMKAAIPTVSVTIQQV